HQVKRGGSRGIAVLIDPDLVPRRQSLNVRWKDILSDDGDAHEKDRLHEQRLRARRPRSVDGADFQTEIIYAWHRSLLIRSNTTAEHAEPAENCRGKRMR